MPATLAAFVLAALIAVTLTPLVLRAARHFGVMSRVGGRHINPRHTPRLGGVALCVAMFAPVLLLAASRPQLAALLDQQQLRAFGLISGGALMCLLGAADDTRGLGAYTKLAAHVGVAVFAYHCGYRIDAITLPLVGELSMGAAALPVTVLWICGITNALNLIDGLDGLAVGVAFFAGLTNIVVAIIAGQLLTVVMMCALLGALLGFLLYNFNPARIFAGDSGSYLLGYVLAVTALSGTHKTSTAVALLVPIVALGLPIFDMLYAMVRRVWARRPMFAADRGHVHHRLLDVGMTHRRAVLSLYGLSVAFTIAAIVIYLGRSWQIGVALALASALVIGLVRFVRPFSQQLQSHQREEVLQQEAAARSLPLIAETGASPGLTAEPLPLIAEYHNATPEPASPLNQAPIGQTTMGLSEAPKPQRRFGQAVLSHAALAAEVPPAE